MTFREISGREIAGQKEGLGLGDLGFKVKGSAAIRNMDANAVTLRVTPVQK